jgi:DNA-binding response OmpR family regulator
VDDDPKFLHFVTELLTGAGYDVTSTSQASKAVRLAEEVRPRLAILDLAMPLKDGFELADELKANSKTSQIRCMFLTGRPASEGMEEAKDTGALAYLVKPIRSSSLLWMVRTVLAEDSLQQKDQEAGAETAPSIRLPSHAKKHARRKSQL